MMSGGESRPSVAIVGGGLAGMAAAVALADGNCRVQIFEARRALGGRAGSFRDSNTNEVVDQCQHVSMRCCTNLADFCRRVGIADLFRHDRQLHFIGPDGHDYPFYASWLPAPFHLAPAFWGLKFLSVRDRLAIGRATWNLMRMRADDVEGSPTIGAWLKRQGQTPRAIELYWNVILVSALGEELDRASLAAARKVIVDGFLASREAYVVEVPRVPLGELYGASLERWLTEHGIELHLNRAVRRVSYDDRPEIAMASGEKMQPDYVVLAVPWFRLRDLVDASLAQRWPWLAAVDAIEPSPITGVHLWFDRPIMPHEHAVLVGRLSQWVFHRSANNSDGAGGHYYQVVVSASRDLAGRDREEIIDEVCRELGAIWPAAAAAKRLHARVVTDRAAVFSTCPGLDRVRPAQTTGVPDILVAGDWTSTGWPATMESAVRSGYLAAENILKSVGTSQTLIVGDLPRGAISRLLIKG